MAEGEQPHSEGNASDYDTDFECEEEEVGGVQSDSSSLGDGGGHRTGVGGRKRLHSEATAAGSGTETSSSRDAKSKQASNLHNEREKERRKDLKQAVHRLRNQLQIHQTKKATTISVLKASELEIKDLVRMEDSQNRQLAELQTQHKHLTWRLESLLSEQKKDSPRLLTIPGSSGSPTAAPIPSSPLSVLPPPPLTTMTAPVFYMPSTPSGVGGHSPSLPASPHTPSLMIPPHRPISPSTFPFSSFTGLPHPALLSPPVFSPMLTPSPHHPFSLHPTAARPLLVMPPTPFTLPQFLSRLPVTPGRFVFPSAPGTPPPHLPSPSPLLLHSLSPPGPMSYPPHFPMFLAQPTPTSEPGDRRPNTSAPTHQSPSPATPRDKHIYRPAASPESSLQSPQPIQRSADPSPPEREVHEELERRASSESTEEEATQRRYSTDGSELIDVETPDQEEMMEEDMHQREVQPFLGIRCPHRKHRRRHSGRKMKMLNTPYPLQKTSQKEPPPRVLNIAGKNGAPSFTDDHSTSSRTVQDRFSVENLIKEAIEEEAAKEKQFHLWKRRKQSSPSVIDLATRLPTVICS